MLTYTTPDAVADLPDAERFLLLALLTAVRDKAEQLEFRLGDGWALVYQRVDGRDWELLPPPDEVLPDLTAAVRRAARLVRPERPAATFTDLTIGGATIQSPEVGWLTLQYGDDWLDALVQIDPREPGGFVRFDLGDTEAFAAGAAAALNAVYAADDPDV